MWQDNEVASYFQNTMPHGPKGREARSQGFNLEKCWIIEESGTGLAIGLYNIQPRFSGQVRVLIKFPALKSVKHLVNRLTPVPSACRFFLKFFLKCNQNCLKNAGNPRDMRRFQVSCLCLLLIYFKCKVARGLYSVSHIFKRNEYIWTDICFFLNVNSSIVKEIFY